MIVSFAWRQFDTIFHDDNKHLCALMSDFYCCKENY